MAFDQRDIRILVRRYKKALIWVYRRFRGFWRDVSRDVVFSIGVSLSSDSRLLILFHLRQPPCGLVSLFRDSVPRLLVDLGNIDSVHGKCVVLCTQHAAHLHSKQASRCTAVVVGWLWTLPKNRFSTQDERLNKATFGSSPVCRSCRIQSAPCAPWLGWVCGLAVCSLDARRLLTCSPGSYEEL